MIKPKNIFFWLFMACVVLAGLSIIGSLYIFFEHVASYVHGVALIMAAGAFIANAVMIYWQWMRTWRDK